MARGKVRPSDDYVANEMKPYTAAVAELNARGKIVQERKMLLQKNASSVKVYEKFQRKTKLGRGASGKNIVTLKQKPRKSQS